MRAAGWRSMLAVVCGMVMLAPQPVPAQRLADQAHVLPARGQGAAGLAWSERARGHGAADPESWMAAAAPRLAAQGQPRVRRGDVLRTAAWLTATTLAFPLDARIDRWSARPGVQGNDVLRGLSNVGDVTGSYLALGVGPALWAAGAARGDSGLRVSGQRTAAAVALAFVASGGIKVLAGRARPYAVANDPGNWNLMRGLRTDSLRSFSSAHTALATAAAITLAAEWRRQGVGGWRTVGPPLVYTLAGIAGGSRIRDRQHWASDVMMGAAVGTVSALVTRRWFDRRGR